MESKSEPTNWKHGPVSDSIKDFFYDSLYSTGVIHNLNSHNIDVDNVVNTLVKDYLKSVGNYKG